MRDRYFKKQNFYEKGRFSRIGYSSIFGNDNGDECISLVNRF